MKDLEITPPIKVSLAELDAEIKAAYPNVKVLYREEHNTISPQDVRKSTPAAIVVEGADDDAAKAITDIVKAHKPDKSDKEKEDLARAARLFDVLQSDPRMKALLESVRPK